MEHVLIKGRFHVVGYSPDGDSLMFKADNPALWEKIIDQDNEKRFRAKLASAKDQGAVQLRLQGLDAPETHFKPSEGADAALIANKPVGEFKQPSEVGRQATTEFLKFLGVKNGIWKSVFDGSYLSKATLTQNGQEVTVTQRLADHIPGYIVTRDIELNGRPIAWVFRGSTPQADGAAISQDLLSEQAEQSANYYLLQQGLIYPYLFRKVLKFWYQTTPDAATTAVNLAGLCVKANPTLFVVSEADFVKLDEILELKGNIIGNRLSMMRICQIE